jgi:hypothetical protein
MPPFDRPLSRSDCQKSAPSGRDFICGGTSWTTLSLQRHAMSLFQSLDLGWLEIAKGLSPLHFHLMGKALGALFVMAKWGAIIAASYLIYALAIIVENPLLVLVASLALWIGAALVFRTLRKNA